MVELNLKLLMKLSTFLLAPSEDVAFYHLATILKLTNLGVKRLGTVNTLFAKSLISIYEIVFGLSMRLNTSRLAQIFSKFLNGL